MGTAQIIDEIKKLSPSERAEVEHVLSRLKEEERHNGDGDEEAKQSRGDFMDRILARIEQIPEAERDKLPRDLAENHDHYLYGTPKK